MSALARPGVLAAILAAAGLVLHPATGSERWLPGRPGVLAALVLAAALAFVARAAAGKRLADLVAAAGAVVVVAALGLDGLQGHHGTLTLAPGQSRGNFEETGPDGRSLGLRPLGFAVGAEKLLAHGGVALALPGRAASVELSPLRSVAYSGYRFASPRATSTAAAARLRVAASDRTKTEVAEVAPGVPGRAFDLTIALEQYFPDFALDERQQPFSRSAEPRNPAALLTVGRAGEAHRVFVLQSMPGVHRIEALGLAFSLLHVEAEKVVDIVVHREPGALAALAGAVLLAAGLALSLRSGPATGAGADPLAVSGSVLVALLLTADGGAVLAWSFGLTTAAGRVPLPGAGVWLGAALVAALGGSLLFAAQRLAGGGAGVLRAARGALWLALVLGAAGVLVAVIRAVGLPGDTSPARLPLVGLAAALALLAGSLLATRPGASGIASRVGPPVLQWGSLAAVAVAIAFAVSSVRRDGTYATPDAAAAAAAALLGVAAREPASLAGARGFAFLFALVALALR